MRDSISTPFPLLRLILRSLCLCSALCSGHLQHLAAQDRILHQQAGGGRFWMNGYIEDYTGREILLKIKPGETPRRYPRGEVIEVVTEYTPHHDQGRKLYAAGKIAEVRPELIAALEEEDRPWVRREILATQVKCALWIGDYPTAIARFLPLVRSDAETFHYSLVPLNWTTRPPTEHLRFDARDWIASTESPLNRLIGASWLLNVSDGTADAELTLKRLAREPDVRIQRLAQMQLWRRNLNGNAVVDPDEIRRWTEFAEALPPELRGGSYFVIGQAWKQRQEYEQAARSFLWLPLVYDSDRWLSSQACFEAAESLRLAGDPAQAARLYSEIVFRYGDTPWGKQAETLWKETVSKNTKSPNVKEQTPGE